MLAAAVADIYQAREPGVSQTRELIASRPWPARRDARPNEQRSRALPEHNGSRRVVGETGKCHRHPETRAFESRYELCNKNDERGVEDRCRHAKRWRCPPCLRDERQPQTMRFVVRKDGCVLTRLGKEPDELGHRGLWW